MNGVPAKPVEMRYSASAASSASRSPANSTSASSSSPNTIASEYTVVQSLSTTPPETYSRLKAARRSAACASNSACSAVRPSRAAVSARIRADRYAHAVATTPLSALAFAGSSGGASGSSQSPNWKLPSHTPAGESSDFTRRTCETIESNWRSSTAVSPYAS